MSVSGWVHRYGPILGLIRPFPGYYDLIWAYLGPFQDYFGLLQPDLGPFQSYLDYCRLSSGCVKCLESTDMSCKMYNRPEVLFMQAKATLDDLLCLRRKLQEYNLQIFWNQIGFPLKVTCLPVHWHHNIDRLLLKLFSKEALTSDDLTLFPMANY